MKSFTTPGTGGKNLWQQAGVKENGDGMGVLARIASRGNINK